MKKIDYQRVIRILLMIVLVIILCTGMVMPVAFAEGANESYADIVQPISTSSTRTDDSFLKSLCEEYTDRELSSIGTSFEDNIFDYVPIEVVESKETFGYIGQEYGFATYNEQYVPSAEDIFYHIMVFENNFVNDKNTSTYSNELRTVANLTFVKNQETSQFTRVTTSSRLYLSDIVLTSNINTVGEIKSDEGQQVYQISQDESVYVDVVATDYKLFTHEKPSMTDLLVSFAQINVDLAIGAIESYCFGGLPVTSILESFQSTSGTETNIGLVHNSLSYEQQKLRGYLQTDTTVGTQEGLYLGSDTSDSIDNAQFEEDFLKFSYKYDTKDHNISDFQVGNNFAFNINYFQDRPIQDKLEHVGSTDIANDRDVKGYCVNNVAENDGLKFETNTLSMDNDVIIEKSNKYTMLSNPSDKNEFTVTPTETRNYSVVTDNGSQVMLNGALFETGILNKGIEYVFTVDFGDNFYDKFIIDRNSELSIGNNSIGEGYSHFEIYSESINIDMFEFVGMESSEILIYNSSGEIVNDIIGNSINHLFDYGTYDLYIKNNTSELVNSILQQIEGSQVKENNDVYSGSSKYFNFNPAISNFYIINNPNVSIYSINAELLIFDSEVLLDKNTTYYIELTGDSTDKCMFNYEFNFKEINMLNEEESSFASVDDIFKFNSNFTTYYILDSNSAYDIYCDGVILTSDVNKCLFESGKTYYLVEQSVSALITINYFTKNIAFDDVAVNALQNELVKFNNLTEMRYDFSNNANYTLYDSYMYPIVEELGYYLSIGTYYLKSASACNYLIEEKIVECDVILDVITNVKVILDKDFDFGIPKRENREFLGWFSGETQLTGTDGKSIVKWNSNFDTNVKSKWTVSKYYMSIVIDDNELWLTDGGITSNKDDAGIMNKDNIATLIENLLNFQYNNEIKKIGHYLTGFDTSTPDEGEDLYVITPKWEVEKYLVTFETAETADKKIIKNITLEYGQSFDMSTVKSFWEVDGYTFNSWTCNCNTIPELDITSELVTITDLNGDIAAETSYHIITADQTGKKLTILIDIVECEISLEGQVGVDLIIQKEQVERLGRAVLSYSVDSGVMGPEAENYKFTVESENYVNNIVNISMYYNLIPYNIEFDSIGGDSIAVKKYNIETSTFDLPVPTRYGYRFDGWESNGVKINKIVKGTYENVSLCATWSGELSTITRAQTKTINDEVAFVDLSGLSAGKNVLIYVGTDVEEISFLGHSTAFLNVSIDVASRDASNVLTMRLKQMKTKGLNNRSGIDAIDCGYLILESVDENTITSGISNGEAAALTCMSIEIKGDTLNLTGADSTGSTNGRGKDGSSGIIGGSANSGSNHKMVLSISILIVNGGDAGNGTDGTAGESYDLTHSKAPIGSVGETGKSGKNGTYGNSGGMAGFGIMYIGGSVEIMSTCTAKFYGGDGGAGGDGGDGGDGAWGGEGGDAKWFGPSAQRGGHGGDGGDGGDGGSGGMYGVAYLVSFSSGTVSESKDGIVGMPGKGGNGGARGYGGFGGTKLNGDFAESGNPGKLGENGK